MNAEILAGGDLSSFDGTVVFTGHGFDSVVTWDGYQIPDPRNPRVCLTGLIGPPTETLVPSGQAGW
jgi:hypothetical protein